MRGSGTPLDPFLIDDVADLQDVDNDLTAYYELGGDIDATATSGWGGGLGFSPIGLATTTVFTGSFDGKSYTITNLYINRPATDIIGLFYILDAVSTKNAILENPHFTGDSAIGGIAGRLDSGTITDCQVNNATLAGTNDIGGIAGKMAVNTEISDCSCSNLTITGSSVVYTDCGGIAGDSPKDVVITNCHTSGTITAAGDDAAGILAYTTGATITNCTSSCTVQGHSMVGGILGVHWHPVGHGALVMTGCHATGNITGEHDVGGLVGDEATDTYTITDCYAAGDVIGSAVDSAVIGGFFGFAQNGVLATATVSRCYAFGNVSGGTGGYIGGFAGTIGPTTMSECYATGNVTVVGVSHDIGGFGGNVFGTTNNCYSFGNVDAGASTDWVGGFAGYIEDAEYSYSIGAVVCTGVITTIGGFCGEFGGTTMTACYWNIWTSGLTTDGLNSTAIGTSGHHLKRWRMLRAAGWDFVNIWGRANNCNDGYPCLRNVTSGCWLQKTLGNPSIGQGIHQHIEKVLV